MPRRRQRGLRVLKAVSSSLRLKILNLLLERGPLSYTEIMKILKLNPGRDAGRFAYHLKYLLKERLIEPDVEKKRYRLTDLGQAVMSMAEEIEEEFFKRRKMVVRTSRLAMEEFDRTKIVSSLIKEAGVPADLAQKVARETESRLSELKTKYLTAPLIREFVNAVLVEKGLEEYRHRLTRLGLPVYDVTQLIKSIGTASLGVEAVHQAAGDAVLEEYTLLNVLPRDIADAHLSGAIQINNLGCWILKPSEFMHDLRFFLQHGLDLGRTGFIEASYRPPKSIEAALLTASNALQIAATEVSGEQAFDYFNVFMAPFIQGVPVERVKDAFRTFFFNLNQAQTSRGSHLTATLGLELVIPEFLEEEDAIGPVGKRVGCLSDFAEEASLIVSLMMEMLLNDSSQRPLLNPSLIVKMRPEVFSRQECEDLSYKSHKLAAEKGLPYFANLCIPQQKQVSYTATGCRFAADWKGEWELDTVRTGSLDSVIINLPRISYEAEQKEPQFFEGVDQRLEMALRALEMKYQTVKQRTQEGLLPFLMHEADGDHYFRLQNTSRLVSFVGLNETAGSFFGKDIHEDDQSLLLAEKIAAYIYERVQKYEKKPETRNVLSMIPCTEAARRLAGLDVENYGWAKVHAQGDRQHPFYTDLVAVPLTSEMPWKKRLEIEGKFHQMTPGGHLAIIQLSDSAVDPDSLLSATRALLETEGVGLYTYNRHLSYCGHCQKTFPGLLAKCPSCGSVNSLSSSSRVSAKHSASSFWDSTRRTALGRRQSYTLA